MKERTLIILTALLLIGGLNGCSLIGYSAGSQIDNPKLKEHIPTYSFISKIDSGSVIDITLYDGNEISAKYLGLESLNTLVVKTDNKIQKFTFDDIKQINESSSYTGRILGLITGLALDIIVLKIVVSSMTIW